jgi:hypothetical protein
MTASADEIELFHHLAAQATAELEDAATLALRHQTGPLPRTLDPLLDRTEAAVALIRAAQTIVDRNA